MGEHYIQYNIFLGVRPDQGVLFHVSDELENVYIRHIGFFPRSFEQLAYGLSYYQHNQALVRSVGYMTCFCYADSMDDFCNHPYILSNSCASVNIICTDDEPSLDIICRGLHSIHNDRCLYLALKEQLDVLNLPNSFTNSTDAVSYLRKLLPNIINENPVPIPDFAKGLDRGLLFNPSIPNTLTLHNIAGDFGCEYKDYSQEERFAEQQLAIIHSHEFDRQQALVGQSAQIYFLEKNAHESIDDSIFQSLDQTYAPWIVVLPYTSPDVRRIFEKVHNNPEARRMAKIFRKVVDLPTGKNYTCTIEREAWEGNDVNPLELGEAYRTIFGPRGHILDAMGVLHSSFRFSPYIRLPFLGKDINRNLSFFSTQYVHRLYNSRSGMDSMRSLMETIGREIQSATLSEQLMEQLSNIPRQVVAISDLPIEWTMIHRVPLGFTHDVCRIPETPFAVGLEHYVINTVQDEVIDADIMEHTLVVYGCRDDAFRPIQDECDKLAKTFGFHTAECLTATDFYESIQKHQPKLLIIDTHGNLDPKTHQSFMMMGDDMIRPQDIVDHHIQIPLVYISACSSAPLYNITNTLANGFIESGSLAVTSTYMPVYVGSASRMYLSLLINLQHACKNATFVNWSAFISYVLRESYIRSAYPTVLDSTELKESFKKQCEEVMAFEKRRNIYESLREGFEVSGVRIKAPSVPHYLMYSTIGRADLVKFKGFIEPLVSNVIASVQSQAQKE